MNSDEQSGRTRKPLDLEGVVAFGLLALGLLAWMWTGEWRWGVSGLLALFLLAGLSAYRGR